MHITFSPMRMDAPTPAMSVAGDVLTIDGEAYDFAVLEEGARLPADATGSAWLVDGIERIAGTIHLTVRSAHGAGAGPASTHPGQVDVTAGPVPIPAFETETPDA